MPDERVLDHHREVARHLQLVAAADADPVDPRDGQLADLPQPVVCVLEGPEPLPVLVRLTDVPLAPLLQVGADAEGAAGSGEDHDANVVVPGCVLGSPCELAQRLEVERVQDLRAVEAHGRARRILLVDDPLEAEVRGVNGGRTRRLRHNSTK